MVLGHMAAEQRLGLSRNGGGTLLGALGISVSLILYVIVVNSSVSPESRLTSSPGVA